MGIKNAPFLSVAFIFLTAKNVKQQGEGYLIPKSLLVALKTQLAAVDCMQSGWKFSFYILSLVCKQP